MNHEETPATDFEFQGNPNYDDIILDKYVGDDPIVVIPDEIDGYKVSKFQRIFANNENIVAVRIGNNVTEISNGAFVNCTNLKYLVFGNSVESLGGGNFVNTNLKEVILNEGLQTIGKNDYDDYVIAPTNNKDLQIRIPESVSEIHIADFSLIVKAGSYAETYAKENAEKNNLTYTIE